MEIYKAKYLLEAHLIVVQKLQLFRKLNFIVSFLDYLD